MPMKPREMIRLLEKNGFIVSRVRGDHAFLKNESTKQTTVVPIAHKELGKGLQHKILRDAGLE